MPEAGPVHATKSSLSPRVATFLLALLAAGTRARYLEQAQRFGVWSRDHAPTWASMAIEQQDAWLAEFVLDSRDEGLGVQACRDTVAALQLFWPSRKFRLATRVVNGWAELVPPNRAPPVDRTAAMALVTLMVASGQAWAACATMLCFTALLRISEALTLRLCEVVMTASGTAVVLLRKAKTGDYQRVVLQDRAVVAWLNSYRKFSGIDPDSTELLCGGTYDKFRRVLTRSAAALGLGATAWRSHSFRRGGASALFAAGLPVADIAVYGRWATLSSCRLYLASGEQELLALLQARAPAVRERLEALAALASRVFALSVEGVPAG